MTHGSFTKILPQLKNKPIKRKRFLRHSKPKKRACGFTTKRCRRCGRSRGHISKYGLNLCRQCFRQIAKKVGFVKYS